jgi:hypothetical protein
VDNVQNSDSYIANIPTYENVKPLSSAIEHNIARFYGVTESLAFVDSTTTIVQHFEFRFEHEPGKKTRVGSAQRKAVDLFHCTENPVPNNQVAQKC